MFAFPAAAQDTDTSEAAPTPPRLSFVDGEVSFWRAGADDWSPAQVNTPLDAGDQLYAGSKANLEIQVGPRAFVRGGEDTQLGFSNLAPDFVQLRIASGHVSLDLRTIKAGTTIELDTPQAAFTVEAPGYYRVEVSDQNTTFTSRRGGRATVIPENGNSAAVASSEQVVVSGGDPTQLATYAAPELDDWDRWNYTRTDQQLDAVSSRYVPYGVYGVDDLDHYGDWRVVPTYGSVWVPRVASGWAPYSSGAWVADPYYGWTWVDAAPWGWAPFHYGRWVSVGGYWGWAPGPLVVRPYYAPALVAFFDVPGVTFGFSFGHAATSWVALGWGEPCIPWWGSSGWRGHPHWAGWGGPRVVNNVVINNTTIVNVNDVHGWSNAQRHGAVVGVSSDQFGRGRVRTQHFDPDKVAKFRPVHGDLDQKPTTASFAPSTQRGVRPPREDLDRTVVATREPRLESFLHDSRNQPPAARQTTARDMRDARPSAAPVDRASRIVQPQPRGSAESLQNRPPFGASSAVRAAPQRPPRFGGARAPEQGERMQPVPASPATRAEAPPAPPSRLEQHVNRASRPADNAARAVRERPQSPQQAQPRNLPGEPANRVFQRAQPEPQAQPQRMERPQHETHREPQRARSQQSDPAPNQQPQAEQGGASHGGGGNGHGMRGSFNGGQH